MKKPNPPAKQPEGAIAQLLSADEERTPQPSGQQQSIADPTNVSDGK